MRYVFCARCSTPRAAYGLDDLPRGWEHNYERMAALCPGCARAEREHAYQTRPVDHGHRGQTHTCLCADCACRISYGAQRCRTCATTALQAGRT